MIEVNLLPHREAKRLADLRESFIVLLLGALLVLTLAVVLEFRIGSQLERANASVAQLDSDIARFKPQEEEVAAFRKQKVELEEKLAVIRKLDLARKGPVKMFEELASRTPDRLWLTQLSARNGQLWLQGNSLDNDVIADFLQLLGASDYFEAVDLIRTNGDTEEEGVRLVEFEINVDFVIPDSASPSDSEIDAAGA